MCTPHLFLLGHGGGGGAGGVSHQPNSHKGGGLTGPQLLEGVAEKEESDFFQGGVAIVTKNKLKSEIFNVTKSL